MTAEKKRSTQGEDCCVQDLSYRLLRSSRRSIALQVKPDGSLVVRAPLRMSRRAVDAFVLSRRGWAQKHQEIQRLRSQKHPEPTPEEQSALKEKARELLPLLTAHYASIMGLEYAGLRITSARTRFGSCSAKDSLSFSWRLMAYPREAIEAVVVHELAHIRHKNHGKEFYALLLSVLPDYRERVRLLRE